MPSEQQNDQSQQPTSIAEWGGGEVAGFVTELPSGNFATVRRGLDMATMLTQGQIPNPLREIVSEMIEVSAQGVIPDKPNQGFDMRRILKDPVALPAFMGVVDKVTCQSMIDPPVSMPVPRGGLPGHPDETQDEYDTRINAWEPDPGTLSIFRVDVRDRMFLFALAQGAAADVKTFREEQGGDVPAASDGKSVRGATKRTGGPAKRPGKKAAAKKSAAKKKAPARKR